MEATTPELGPVLFWSPKSSSFSGSNSIVVEEAVGMLHQALTGILTEQKVISDCRYWVFESSSLIPILFREVFIHPYISFFHLLVI